MSIVTSISFRRLGLVVLLITLLPAGIALAHPKILTSQPAANAELTHAPSRVELFFNETIEQNFAQLQVLNQQGNAVDLGDGARAAEDPTILRASLPQLPAGIYTVIWQVLGSDGHVVKGYYVFSVIGEQNTAPELLTETAMPTSQPILNVPGAPPPIAEPEPPIAWLAFLRGLMLAGALIATGGCLFLTWVIQPLYTYQIQLRGMVADRMRLLVSASLVILLVSTCLFLVVHTTIVASQITSAALWQTLSGTRLGQAAVLRMFFAILILAGIRLSITTRILNPLIWLICAALLATFAASGHAAAEASPVLPILSDWLHLLASAVWVGGLAAFAISIPIVRQHSAEALAEIFPALFGHFSQAALASVVLVAATGCYAATLHLQQISDLWQSSYGQTLSIKLGLFLLLIGFGAYHRFTAPPESISQQIMTAWISRLQRTIPIEACCGLAVIASVGLLTTLPLPNSQAATPTPTPVVQPSAMPVTPAPTRTPTPVERFDQEQTAADIRVRLQIDPASLGQNDLIVTITDAGGAPIEVQRVQADLQMQAMDMGVTQAIAEAQGNGRYSIRQQWLSMVGEWQITILVRRSDADDVRLIFRVPVGG
jgi:copper transport protein